MDLVSQDPSPSRDGAEPHGGQERAVGGNVKDGRPTVDPGTEAVVRELDAELWGYLPSYVRQLQLRRGGVQVPERYRRLYEAFLRRSDRQGRRGGSRAGGSGGDGASDRR